MNATSILRARPLASFTVALALLLTPTAPTAATITIVNADGAGEGFNDPMPVAPVGGNPGSTRGAQRLFVFQHAADIWGAILPSSVTILVSAKFDAQACDASSAVLGSAGPITVAYNFSGAAFTNTWYHIALANKLAGMDLDPSGDDIGATFNSTLDGGTCLGGARWYYGVDGNEGADVELLPVVLHELGHGLGFSTLVNSMGGQVQNRPDLFERFLLDDSSGLHWNQMNNMQRAASAINTGNLVWDGASVTAHAGSLLGDRPVVRVDSPAGIAGEKPFGTADFGPPLSDPPLAGSVVLVNDGSGTTSDACEPIVNAAQVAGNIALIDRGTCPFVDKAARAEAAGAIAVVIVNNVSGDPPFMTGVDPGIGIPVVSLTLADGNAIKSNLPGVVMTLGVDPTHLAGADDLGHVRMYAPNPYESGSSVSHWDVAATPDLLMEPFINNGLSSNVDLTRFHFEDLGWTPAISSVAGPRPIAIRLRGAPNPFGAATAIAFELERGADVTLDVYDLGGRRVRRLADGWREGGSHTVAWNGTDERGVRLPPGVYLCRLEAGGGRRVERMVRLD